MASTMPLQTVARLASPHAAAVAHEVDRHFSRRAAVTENNSHEFDDAATFDDLVSIATPLKDNTASSACAPHSRSPNLCIPKPLPDPTSLARASFVQCAQR